MNPFRSILATLLAILIASPLCCCSALAADAPAGPSCCQSKKEGNSDRAPHICACKTKEPRDEAKAFELPGDLVTPFVPVVQDLGYLCQPLSEHSPIANTPHADCGPPRLKLARISRWLI